MRALGRPLEATELQEALDALESRCLVSNAASGIKRQDPDFPERSLEDPIQRFLTDQTTLAHLRIDPARTIVQRTARGGKSGTGIWSRPDFTIATIRKRKYDPYRHLDVIAFELKNLAGTSVVAVHEALAHTRFAHYAYVVCPRSERNHEVAATIEAACSQHGIGLVTFSIAVDASGNPDVSDLKFELAAARFAADPDFVDNYIDDRLDNENREKLLMWVEGD